MARYDKFLIFWFSPWTYQKLLRLTLSKNGFPQTKIDEIMERSRKQSCDWMQRMRNRDEDDRMIPRLQEYYNKKVNEY